MTVNEGLLQELADRDAIQRVMARYCRGVDRGDVELIRSVYWPDAQEDHGYFRGDVSDYLKAPRPQVVTMLHHTLGQSSIDLTDDRAFCETYWSAAVVLEDGPTLARIFGRYLCDFERRDGEWKISERAVVHDITQEGPLGAEFRLSLDFVRGVRGPDDPVYRPDALLARLGQGGPEET